MLQDIFTDPGKLHMSDSPLPSVPDIVTWGDYLQNRVLVLVSVVLVLISLRDILRLMPQLLYCLGRPGSNQSFEYNIGIARMRDSVALVCALPFCLVVSRCGLWHSGFTDAFVPVSWQSPLVIAVLLLWLLLRSVLLAAMMPRKLDSMGRAALRHNPFNYFIPLTFVMLVLVAVLPYMGVGESALRIVMYSVLALASLLSIMRSGHILASYCGPLPTILYLCALEILPMFAVIAPALWL